MRNDPIMDTSIHREKWVPTESNRFCVWKEKQRMSCPGWNRYCPPVQKKNMKGFFAFVIMMAIKRLKLFTFKITLNFCTVHVQYSSKIELWNYVASNSVIWHISEVQILTCSHRSHIYLIKSRGLMLQLPNSIQMNSMENGWPDFHLQYDDGLHCIKWPKHTWKSILHHPGRIMSPFCQRKEDLKGFYTFITNNTGIQICIEPKGNCDQNTADITGFALQRRYSQKLLHSIFEG